MRRWLVWAGLGLLLIVFVLVAATDSHDARDVGRYERVPALIAHLGGDA